MANDEAGGRQPPTKHQFIKGRSGNPRGRPKGSQNLKTLVGRAIDKKYPALVDRKRINLREAIIVAVVQKALKGSLKHAMWIFEHDAAQQAATPGRIVIELDMGSPGNPPG